MIYESQEIAEFFKGKIIEEPKDLKEAKLTTKSIEQQQKIVLEGLKTLDKESLIKVKKWIERTDGNSTSSCSNQLVDSH